MDRWGDAMTEEEEVPIRKRRRLERLVLDTLGIEELRDYIGELRDEIARVEADIDRQARRHGRAMLQALGAVQLSMLDGGGDAARAQLAAAAAQAPAAHDPVLRLILREISLRAAVELARGDR